MLCGILWVFDWCRVLRAVKDRLASSAAEREAKRKIEIKSAGDVPKSMQVKQSPVSSNGNGKS